MTASSPRITLQSLNYRRDSSGYYLAVRHLPHPVWLDSANNVYGRFDIISAAPSQWLSYPTRRNHLSPFALLRETLAKRRPVDAAAIDVELPFLGGAIGYFSYDLCRYLEKLPALADDDVALPQLAVGIYEWAIIQDHKTQQAWLMQREGADQCILDELQQRLQEAPHSPASFSLLAPFSPEQHKVRYLSAIERIQSYIRAGDCYQVNYTQRFSAPYGGDLLSAYCALRSALPSPFSAFMELDEGAVLSISPERFIAVNKGVAETRPIKGTVARHDDKLRDQQAAETLQNSAKDRAENLMIVDLLRNDFSKCCELHSVKVPELFSLISFRNVHHLVSAITGTLKAENTALDLLEACFPGGSITGAPKKRAMEIIEEMEPCRRSVYCGSVAYLSDCGRMDSSIAIRTLVADGETLHCWGGGGITADSEPEAEYQESLDKISLLLQTLETYLTQP